MQTRETTTRKGRVLRLKVKRVRPATALQVADSQTLETLAQRFTHDFGNSIYPGDMTCTKRGIKTIAVHRSYPRKYLLKYGCRTRPLHPPPNKAYEVSE